MDKQARTGSGCPSRAAVSFLSVMIEDYLRTLDQASPFHPVNDCACDSVLQIQMMTKSNQCLTDIVSQTMFTQNHILFPTYSDGITFLDFTIITLTAHALEFD